MLWEKVRVYNFHLTNSLAKNHMQRSEANHERWSPTPPESQGSKRIYHKVVNSQTVADPPDEIPGLSK